MTVHTDENNFEYYLSVEEAREDDYAPVKCNSVLQFFELKSGIDPDMKENIKMYAQNLIEESIRLGRQQPLSMATAVAAAKEFYNIPETESPTDLIKRNLTPITDLKYMVLAKYPGGDRYFTRTYHNYSLDELFWYRRSPTFSGEDTAIENLRRYITDGRVTLLLTKDQVANTSEMLRRVYKAQFKKDGQLDYRVYLKLLDLSLRYEDYKDVSKDLTGFRTVCKQYDDAINELWKSVMK